MRCLCKKHNRRTGNRYNFSFDQEQELRYAIEDAKSALDDSKRRFLLVLLFGGIVIAAASAWAALAMTQPFALV